MITTFYIWVSCALGTLLLEMGHPGLFLFLSFSFGSTAGAIASLFDYSLAWQLGCALAATIAAFALLRTYVARQQHKMVHTNVHALPGAQGVVIKAIEPHATGQVKVHGQIWSARAHDTIHTINPQTPVRVVYVRGSHIIVQSLHQHKTNER